jgi:uncharacterized protein with von Willebrand factor type A (vWA) domain
MTLVDDVDVAGVSAAFSQLLHRAGVPATPERSGRFAQSIVGAAPATVDELYWLARVTLVADHAQLPAFDAVFAQVVQGITDVADQRGESNEPPPAHARAGTDHRPGGSEHDRHRGSEPSPGMPGPGHGEAVDEDAEPMLVAAASPEERLRTKDFAVWTPEELALLRSLIVAIRLDPPQRSSRRYVRRHHGERLDVRATIRRSHRTAGDPVEHVVRRHKQRPRRLVLIADVSGSMEPYARAYLHLLHGAVRATKAEAFVFATRLTRLTRDLAVSNPDVALQRASAATPDWSGGTRIGSALAAFNDRYGRRGMARGAIVVIVSDGWERDDPSLVATQMVRLSRLARTIIWVNPRTASPRYSPLVAGMSAALPHVDRMISGHSLASMEELLEAIRST